MITLARHRYRILQITDLECEVDWGVEGRFRGIICKYNSRHPLTPWTIYYPEDGDMEHGCFAKGFSEWRALDESRPEDPLTERKILQWYCGVAPTVLPQPPAGWDASAFEPVLGTSAELPHNRAEDVNGGRGAGGSGGRAAAAAASASHYMLRNAVGPKRSAVQQQPQPKGRNGSRARASKRPKAGPPPVEFPTDATNWDVIVTKEAASDRYHWAHALPGTAHYPPPAGTAASDNAASAAASSGSGDCGGAAASSGAGPPRLHPNEVTDRPLRRHLLEAVGLWLEVPPDCVVLLFRLEDIVASSQRIKATGVCPPAQADLTGRDFVVLAGLPLQQPPAGSKAARECVAPLAVCRQLRGATQGPRESEEGAGVRAAAAAAAGHEATAGREAAAAAEHEAAAAAGPNAAAATRHEAAAGPEAEAVHTAEEVAQLFAAAKAGGAFRVQARSSNKTTAGGGALETSGMTFAALTPTSSPGWYAHLRDPEHGARRRGLLAALLRGLCAILAAQHGHHTAMLRAYSGNGDEPLGPGTGPFCTASYTANYANRPHLDQSDPPLSYITWWLTGLGALLGGAFRLANVRVRFTPLQGTTLLLNSRLLYHGTERCRLLLPSGEHRSGNIQRIGSALWLRDSVVGSWLAWRAGAQRRFPGVGAEEAEARANGCVAAAVRSVRSATRRGFIEAGREEAADWFKHEAVAEAHGCWGVAELPEGVQLAPPAC